MENKVRISLSPQKSTLSEVSEARQMLCLVSAMPLLTAHYYIALQSHLSQKVTSHTSMCPILVYI